SSPVSSCADDDSDGKESPGGRGGGGGAATRRRSRALSPGGHAAAARLDELLEGMRGSIEAAAAELGATFARLRADFEAALKEDISNSTRGLWKMFEQFVSQGVEWLSEQKAEGGGHLTPQR
ncbi:unnamed protein product, partial [Phaeothamnion confervicola]